MRVGDLVRFTDEENPMHPRSPVTLSSAGIVLRIDFPMMIHDSLGSRRERIFPVVEVLWDCGQLSWIERERLEVL